MRLVAGAFDLDAARGRAFGVSLGLPAERCYPDAATMFAAEAQRAAGIEVVSVATPNSSHHQISKAALQAGLHVICEKPLTIDEAQAEELRAIAQQRGMLAAEDADRIERLIARAGLPVRMLSFSTEAYWAKMGSDKKVKEGRIRFILPARLGAVKLVDDVTRDEVEACLAAVMDCK